MTQLGRQRGALAVTRKDEISNCRQHIDDVETGRLLDMFLLSRVKDYVLNPLAELQRFKTEFESVGKKLDPAVLAKDRMQSLLMLACIFGHIDVVKQLTSMGLPRAYFTMRDVYGRTALYVCIALREYRLCLSAHRFSS